MRAQLWRTLCNTMDCIPPASSVHGIFQARILELVAISDSKGSSQGLNSCLLCLLHWQVGYLPLMPNYTYIKLRTVKLILNNSKIKIQYILEM